MSNEYLGKATQNCPFGLCQQECGRGRFLLDFLKENPNFSTLSIRRIIDYHESRIDDCLQPEVLKEVIDKLRKAYHLDDY